MRKILLAISLVLTVIAPIFALDGLYLSEGDSSAVTIYSPRGQVEDPLTSINSDGYIIHTGESGAVFTCAFGDMTLESETLMAVTGFNEREPSIYLLDGMITLDVKSIGALTVYTSSASYQLGGSGQFVFVYTSLLDAAFNNSPGTVTVYDALRRQTSVIRPYHYSDLLGNLIDRPIASQNEFELEDRSVSISGRYLFRDIPFNYSFSTNGSGSVTYPAGIITEGDIASFMAVYLANCGIAELSSVTYAYSDGALAFSYPALFTADEIRYVVNNFIDFLDHYLSDFFIPAAPSFQSVSTEVLRTPPAAPTLSKPAVRVEGAEAEATASVVVEEPAAEPEIPTAPAAPTFTVTVEKPTARQEIPEGVVVPPAPFMVGPWVIVEER